MPSDLYLIVGLGNPGREYQNTRHNVGFMLVNLLAQRQAPPALPAKKPGLFGRRGAAAAPAPVAFTKREGKALTARITLAGQPVLLAKPQTYMNLSGEAVRALVNFYQVPTERLLVAFDEIDLPLGTLRLRPEGGSAGHNGMRSIIEQLGTEKVPRLRIGVGRPSGSKAAAGYVLKDFRGEDLEIITSTLDRAADAAETFVRDGLTTAMNRFNGAAEPQ